MVLFIFISFKIKLIIKKIRKKYGKFGHITRDEFLKTIDEEPPTTWIVIHLYEPVPCFFHHFVNFC